MLKLIKRETPPEETIESLIEDLNGRIRWEEEYYSENEDCAHAEYAASFQYGELDYKDALRACSKYHAITDAIESWSTNGIFELLERHCELEVRDICSRGDIEICSVTVGECEVDVEDILKEYNTHLWPAETLEYVMNQVDGMYRHDGDCYINLDYTRWVMVLDEESLLEELGIEN